MDYSIKPNRKNPSRETCENIIRRILTAEVSEKGKNESFRSASDFMNYFESLYPASDGLTKQVQRAIRSLNMPKDEKGYFIPNKTVEEVAQERELRHLFSFAKAEAVPLPGNVQTLLVKMDRQATLSMASGLLNMIASSPLFDGAYITAHEVVNGILFYTTDAEKLEVLINSLIS